jgi:hypothetical protein
MTDALCECRAEEYVPLKKRRQMEEERRLLLRKRLQVCDEKQKTLLAEVFLGIKASYVQHSHEAHLYCFWCHAGFCSAAFGR